MPILPRFQRVFNGFPQSNKIVERSAAFIEVAADCGFGQIPMAMTQRIVAFAVEPCVFGVRKNSSAQTVCRVKSYAHPEEDSSVVPHFGKKSFALVQSNAIQWRHRLGPLIDSLCPPLPLVRA